MLTDKSDTSLRAQVSLIACSCSAQALSHWKYLGLVFTATRGVAGGMLEMQRQQNAAAGLLRRRFKRLDCHYSVDVMMHLYLTTIAPTASYGCEVRGLRRMVAECRTGRYNLEASYVQTMRELCGVRRFVPAAVLLQELGELPLAVEWKRQTLRFWSALTALPEASIFKQAAMDDLAAAQQSNKQLGSWTVGMCEAAWHGADSR